MDLDDKVVHYLLWFGGMVVASGLHRLADTWGWDSVKWIKWHWRFVRAKRRKKKA